MTEESVPFYKREISFRRKRTTPEETPDTAIVGEDEANEIAAQAADHKEADEVVEEPSASDVAEVVGFEDAPVEEAAAEQVAEPVEEENIAAVEPGSPAGEIDEPSVAELVEPVEGTPAVEDVDPAPAAAAEGTFELGAASEDDMFFIEDTPAPKGRFSSRKDKRTEKAPRRKPPRGGKGRRVVGLKIGASQIAAAVVAETDAGHELVQLARRPLAAGIVVDGEVRDKDALTNALKAFFDEEKLPKKDVRIGVGGRPGSVGV